MLQQRTYISTKRKFKYHASCIRGQAGGFFRVLWKRDDSSEWESRVRCSPRCLYARRFLRTGSDSGERLSDHLATDYGKGVGVPSFSSAEPISRCYLVSSRTRRVRRSPLTKRERNPSESTSQDDRQIALVSGVRKSVAAKYGSHRLTMFLSPWGSKTIEERGRHRQGLSFMVTVVAPQQGLPMLPFIPNVLPASCEGRGEELR